MIALAADHSTDSNTGAHTADPVPALLYTPSLAGPESHSTVNFGEKACSRGNMPRQSSHELLLRLLDLMAMISAENASLQVFRIDAHVFCRVVRRYDDGRSAGGDPDKLRGVQQCAGRGSHHDALGPGQPDTGLEGITVFDRDDVVDQRIVQNFWLVFFGQVRDFLDARELVSCRGRLDTDYFNIGLSFLEVAARRR